jgi:hypothetical protein
VTLVDQRGEMGGTMSLAAKMRSTPDFHRFLDWSEAELNRLGVTRTFGNRYKPGTFAAVGDATGGVPVLPDVVGADLTRVQDIRTWLSSGSPELESCVIWGADAAGMAAADTLATRGTAVLLLGAEPEIAPESGRRAKILAVPRLRSNPEVRIVLGVQVVEITDDKVGVRAADGADTWLDAPGPFLVSQGLRASPDGPARPAAVTGPAATIRQAVTAGHRVAAEVAAALR